MSGHVTSAVAQHGSHNLLHEMGGELVDTFTGGAFAGATLAIFAYQIRKEFKEIEELEGGLDKQNEKLKKFMELTGVSDMNKEQKEYFEYCKNLSLEENATTNDEVVKYLENQIDKLKDMLEKDIENYKELKMYEYKMLTYIKEMVSKNPSDGGGFFENFRHKKAFKNVAGETALTTSTAGLAKVVTVTGLAGGPVAGLAAAVKRNM